MADEKKEFDLDSILAEVGGDAAPAEPPKKPVFQLNLDLDSEYGEPIPGAVAREETTTEEAPVHTEPDHPRKTAESTRSKGKTKPKKKSGCLKGIIYAVVVLALAGTLAYFVIVGGLDFTGITRDNVTVDISIPAGATTEVVAQVLADNGLIDQPFIFRLYSKISKADGKWQPGGFSLQPDMGYSLLIENLQTTKKRKTVKVTIPEGFTVYQIAERLENKGVCTTNEFYRALAEGDFSDYEFIAALSDVDPADYDARFYAMEGYLFPDTYEFYAGCSGESAVRKFLDGFDMRLNTTLRTAAKNQGLTIDELIIIASIVQGEAASKDDMEMVARVLWNRLENPDVYPKLQCDSTGDYVTDMLAANTSQKVQNEFYDTYEREGLPVGAINNPGLDAIKAVLYPSEEQKIMECFFFATDYKRGITYFSKTYDEHVRICKRYGIGMYG